jgi:hypothetical protein
LFYIKKYSLYIFIIVVIIFSSCEKKDDTVIDPTYYSPLISNPYLSKDTVFTSSFNPKINFNVSVFVNTNGGGTIKSVKCKLYDPGNRLLATIELNDNGIPPDSISNDSRYSGIFNISGISCEVFGIHNVQFIAENNSGLFSNLISLNLPVLNTSNFPTRIFGLISPDSIIVPTSGSAFHTLAVSATDTNGYCDIKQVYFKSYRPDGTPTNNGNPYPMFDDGNLNEHGDTTLGDGRFSLIIRIDNTQSIFGYYKFIYQAQDNSNSLSNQIIDSIKIVPPVKK